MKHLKKYKIFERIDYSKIDYNKVYELLIDSFKNYLEQEIDNIKIDGWGDILIFSYSNNKELIRFSNHKYYTRLYIKDELTFVFKDLAIKLSELISNFNRHDEISRFDYEEVIKLLDRNNYRKLQALKKVQEFNL